MKRFPEEFRSRFRNVGNVTRMLQSAALLHFFETEPSGLIIFECVGDGDGI